MMSIFGMVASTSRDELRVVLKDFDRANPWPPCWEGSSDCELLKSQVNLIQNLMSGECLTVDEA